MKRPVKRARRKREGQIRWTEERHRTPTLQELFEDDRAIDEALKEAARDAWRLHKALDNPMATWKED
jgi:hypothetical protein